MQTKRKVRIVLKNGDTYDLKNCTMKEVVDTVTDADTSFVRYILFDTFSDGEVMINKDEISSIRTVEYIPSSTPELKNIPK